MTPRQLQSQILADLEASYAAEQRNLAEAQKFLRQSLESVTFWTGQAQSHERQVESLSESVRKAREEMGE